MRNTGKIATIFGGTGFVGRHIVQRLAKAGYTVKVATRAAESAYFLKPCGAVGQVVPFTCDYSAAGIAHAVQGADVVINLIGLLSPQRRCNFKRAHVELAQQIAQASTRAKVSSFIHISALGVDKAESHYAQTKRDGEEAVRSAFSSATILRPSVIFGPEDQFFNMIARLAQLLPALILVGGGKTKLQPVYVGDVADAVMASINNPKAQGVTFELGGPAIATLRDIYEGVFNATDLRKPLIPTSFCLSKLIALPLSVMPNPLLTPDQVTSLKTDNILSGDLPGLESLGVTPTSMISVVPGYLAAYRRGGRFADRKQA